MDFTNNRRIATKPFETTSVKLEIKNGFARVAQKERLTELLVLADTKDGEYKRGDIVHVLGDNCKHEIAKHIFEGFGGTFILLPYDLVLGVTRGQ